MVLHRRNKIKGGVYFFTVAFRDRRSKLPVEQIELLRNAMKKARAKYSYEIIAIVILPEHMHAIWKMAEGNSDYSSCWRLIKSYFIQGLLKQGIKLNRNKRGEYQVWQRRYWEHTIRNDKDLEKHVNYIHFNPVKHGLVKCVSHWPYSSFHKYVKQGLLNSDWGGKDIEGGFGE